MARREPILLTIEAAAEALAISRSKLYLLIQRGEIVVTRIGRSVRISPETLAAFVARNTKPARVPEED